MKKFSSYLVLTLTILVVLVGCNYLKQFEKNENGLKYKIYTDNKGKKLKEGDVVSLIFTMKNSKDSIFGSAVDKDKPFVLPLRKPLFKGSVEEGLMLLTKGDSATFLVNADSMFKGGMLPPFIAKGSEVKFDIKILKIQTQEEYQKDQMAMMQKEQERLSGEVQKHVELDENLIKEYLKKNNINATRTSSGLYYVIEKVGDGPKPVSGDSVQVGYTGKLLDGTKFDSSYDQGRSPFEFPVGVGAVIPGWDEGIMLLNKGGKAKLFIPSGLAYRQEQAGPLIKPFSVLMFDVELVDVKKKK